MMEWYISLPIAVASLVGLLLVFRWLANMFVDSIWEEDE